MLAELLLAFSDADVVVAGRDLGKAERAADELGAAYPGRVTARCADARDAGSLGEAFAGVDLVAVAASVLAFADVVIETALRAGVDYFDLLLPGTVKHRALERLLPHIELAGRCFITDGGVHPGLSAPLIRVLTPAFGRLERADVGALLRVDWNAYRFSVSTIEEFVDELLGYRMEALRDGLWQRARWDDTMRTFDFGPPFGRERCFVMAMNELRGLPEFIPSLRDGAFYVAGFNRVVDNIIMPLAYATVKPAPGVFGPPYARLLTWALKEYSRPPYGTVWQVEAEGVPAGTEQGDGSGKGAGRRRRAGLRLSHPDGYRLTAAAAAACLLQYFDGTLRAPGVHLQALAVDPARFLLDLLRMGASLQSYGVEMQALLAGGTARSELDA